MIAVMIILGFAVLVAAGFVGWRKRTEIALWLYERELVKHAIVWGVLAVIYVGLLTLGGYLGHKNFLLTVSVVFAIIAVAGKESLNQFGEHDFYQVVQISLLVVAIVSWLWPTVALVATLPFVFALVWVLNVMPDRWPEFAGKWGRRIVYRAVQVIAVLIISWTVLKFTFPELAAALSESARDSEHTVAAWVKNPTFGPAFSDFITSTLVKSESESKSKVKVSPVSEPASAPNASAAAAGKSTKFGREINYPSESLGVVGKASVPFVSDVVAGNPTGKAMPKPAPTPKKRGSETDNTLRQLEAEFPD